MSENIRISSDSLQKLTSTLSNAQVDLNPHQIEAELIEIELPDGTIVEKEGKAFICRCGKSTKQPFCDGAHKNCEFED